MAEKKVKLRNLKGTKDYHVKEKILMNKLISIITEAYQTHGYNPLETPIIEFRDILSSKYAGGAEILKETFMLEDNGKRKLALRYDLTVPFCRYVGMNERHIKMPFKRYEIGKVFRDGPIKLGRLREFYQCDADIVGSDNLIYDAEALAVMSKVYSQIADFYIEINNRKILVGIIEQAGLQNESLISGIILSIDKLKKIGVEGVKAELEEKGIGPSIYEPIFELIITNKENMTNEELIGYYEQKLTNPIALEGLKEIKTIFGYCKTMGIYDKIRFRPELARGLEIYTGTIYEAFFVDSEITSSIGAGGRYDKIIGKFLGKDKTIPAVGFTIGLDVILSEITNFPEKYSHLLIQNTIVDVLVIPMKIELGEVLPSVTSLRNSGLYCDIYTKSTTKLKNALSYASDLNIPIAVIIGHNELNSDQITIKDLINREQITVESDRAADEIKKILKKIR